MGIWETVSIWETVGFWEYSILQYFPKCPVFPVRSQALGRWELILIHLSTTILFLLATFLLTELINGNIGGYSEGRTCRKSVHCLQMLRQPKKRTASSQKGKLFGNLNLVIHPICEKRRPLKMICSNLENDFSNQYYLYSSPKPSTGEARKLR